MLAFRRFLVILPFLFAFVFFLTGCKTENESSQPDTVDVKNNQPIKMVEKKSAKKSIIYFSDKISKNDFELENSYREVIRKKPSLLRYDIDFHHKSKSIYHHPSGEANNMIKFKDIYVEPFVELKFSIGVFTESQSDFVSDGVGFKVILWDEDVPEIIFHQKVEKFDAWRDVRVDLSKYEGKKITIGFKTDYLGHAEFDWAAWGAPCLATYSLDKDYEVKEINSAEIHESLVDYYDKVKFSKNGERRVDRGWIISAVKTDVLLSDIKFENIVRYELIVLDKSDLDKEQVKIEVLDQNDNTLDTRVYDVTHTKQTIQGEYQVVDQEQVPGKIRVSLSPQKTSIIFIKEPIRCAVRESDQTTKNNIILISLDTLRADRLSCYGYDRDVSPNIDAIVSESFIFTNAFSNSNWTLPAHTSMFISRYPSQHQIVLKWPETYDFYSSQWPYYYMTEGVKTQDYLTIAFTGGGYVNSRYGFNKGFDYHIEEVKELNEESLELLIHVLNTNKEKPMFLFFHTYEIHDYVMEKPFYFRYIKNRFIPEGEIRLVDVLHLNDEPGLDDIRYDKIKKRLLPEEGLQYTRNLYDGALAYTDQLMGDFFHGLKEMGLYDNSWIIITSDHGEGLGEVHNNEKTTSYRHGPRLYDDQIKIPLIIKPPKNIMDGVENKKIDQFVQLVDIPPTILSILGLDPHEQFIGKNLLALMENKRSQENLETFSENISNKIFSVMKDGYKLIMIPKSHRLENEGQYRYELYNLEKDKNEHTNLLRTESASKYSPILNELKRDLSNHLATLFNRKNAATAFPEAQMIDQETGNLDPKKIQRLKELGYL